jgi:pimeloyl-ACP methyl ester carboxylesterase
MIDTPHGYVHVRSAGDGGIPLLMLHYSPGSGLAFQHVLPMLGADRLVIAPDRLGFGMSDPAPEDVDIPMWAEATLAVIDHFGVEQFDLVGTHTGTVEALEVATAYSDRVRRVVLVSIPLFNDEQNAYLRTKGSEALRPAPAEDGSHLAPKWRAMVDLSEGRYFQGYPLMAWVNPDAPGAGRGKWSAELRQQFFLWSQLGSTHLAYAANFEYPLLESLRKIRQPLLVLNTQDDLWLFTAQARPLLPPQAIYQEVPDLDMLAFELGPEEMSTRIRAFLDGVEAAG